VTRPRLLRALPALVVLALTVLVALGAASSAGASTVCGKKVLGDWFDNGRIDRLYPLNCYEEAIDAIPPDIRDYANAEEVITRALQNALHGRVGGGGCDPSPDGSTDDCPGGTGGSGGGSGGDGSGGQAAPGVDTSNPSSVPIPLLVLGAMSIVLLGAGGLGYLSRRRQAAQADGDAGDEEPLS
jgi:hypothetical protein